MKTSFNFFTLTPIFHVQYIQYSSSGWLENPYKNCTIQNCVKTTTDTNLKICSSRAYMTFCFECKICHSCWGHGVPKLPFCKSTYFLSHNSFCVLTRSISCISMSSKPLCLSLLKCLYNEVIFAFLSLLLWLLNRVLNLVVVDPTYRPLHFVQLIR